MPCHEKPLLSTVVLWYWCPNTAQQRNNNNNAAIDARPPHLVAQLVKSRISMPGKPLGGIRFLPLRRGTPT